MGCPKTGGGGHSCSFLLGYSSSRIVFIGFLPATLLQHHLS